MTGVRRDPPPQPAGVPAVRIQGHREDVDRLVDLMVAAGLAVWHSPDVAYPDRNGVTVRRHLKVDLRDQQGSDDA